MLTIVTGFASFARGTAQEHVETASFARKEVVNISTASGKIDIRGENTDTIDVVVTYTFSPDRYDPQFIEKNGELLLREEFKRSSGSGRSSWVVTVPIGTKIVGNSASGAITIEGTEAGCNLNTASGNITVLDTEGDLEINTASGRIEVRELRGNFSAGSASGKVIGTDISGNVAANTASGEIRLQGVSGSLDLNTATGEITARDVGLGYHSRISTATGDIRVELSQSSEYDLAINTATADVTLDYNGNAIKGTFEFEARQSRGRIASPFTFDHETTFVDGGHTYDRKTFTRGSSSPRISLSTSTGTVEVKK